MALHFSGRATVGRPSEVRAGAGDDPELSDSVLRKDARALARLVSQS